MRLALLAALAFAALAAAAPPLEVNLVRDCGGVGDGATYNTAAFERCLALIGGAAGPGTLFVPAGRFLSGPFNITRNDTTVVFGGNCTLVASPDTSAFPMIAPLPSLGQCREYTTLLRYSAFITVWNASHVRLTSNASASDALATLDGNGPIWYAARESKVLKNDPGAIIETMYSDGIEIDHLRVWWSPYWHIHPYASSNVYVHDTDVSSFHTGPETDGIDPDCSHDVLIERVTIDTGDDAIAVKSGWDQPGIDFAHPSYNIVVRDSVLSTGANAFCVGSEMSGGVWNVSAVNVRYS
jgi:polygalacturonase